MVFLLFFFFINVVGGLFEIIFVNEDAVFAEEGRILAKEDELTAREDYAGAERLLEYWVASAKAEGDDRGRLTLYNDHITDPNVRNLHILTAI